MRRLFARLILLTAIVLIVAGLGAAWRLWRALPETDGTVRVDGLHRPVDVLRDDSGVPHIRAASERDAVFALGYVHAQDRLWQMEFQRRLAAGRLAEVLGPAALETDRFMRTIGFARAAREALAALDPDTRSLVDAYTAGVNAFRGAHLGTRLPVEFALVKLTPEPWKPEDVLAWQKVMGWSMSLNWREEILRTRLVSRVGEEGAAALLPAGVPDGTTIVPDLIPPPAPPDTPVGSARDSSGGADAHSTASPWSIDPFVAGGSNNWVIAGARTATGRPLLANDPHLGAQTPGVWYVAHIAGGDLDVIGATLPGTPAVVIGHNRRIAWGVTNLTADVQDLFVERINERDEAEADGSWEPMRIVYETIAVLDAPSVTVRVRITRHGPLISDLLDEGTSLALRWTGHDPNDRTARAFLRLNRAGSWAEFLGAFTDYHLPPLNFVYADVDGNIGYLAPGALPVRASDGRVPLAGWTTATRWQGYVPASELPRSLNPARGFIASANNKAVPDSYPYVVSTSWEPPYRAARITGELSRLARARISDMQRLQMDQLSTQAARLLPLLLSAAPRSDRARDALERLRRWDRDLSGRSAGAALFKAYVRTAAARLFEDDLGPSLSKDYLRFGAAVAKAVDGVAREAASAWCDDVTTRPVEACAQVLGEALEQALEEMTGIQGTSDLSRWRWAEANQVWFPHLPFHASMLLRPFFSRHIAAGGDAYTVNPAMPARDQVLIASYRQIIDMADFDRSLFVLPLGQSGHLLSGRYGDMLDEWHEGRYRALPFTPQAVDAASEERLRLEPAK